MTQGTKRIYIADDEKNIRELIRSFLKNAGYEVEAFETGDALFEAFIKDPPNLIVLDIMMPGTDGLMLCTKIRAHSVVPIIIVSARDSELDRITGITIGSDDYLVKPFSPIELVARINAQFRRLEYNQSVNRSDLNDLKFGQMTINQKTRTVKENDRILDISPTEYEFLRYLFLNQDRAVSREELLKTISSDEDLLEKLFGNLLSNAIRFANAYVVIDVNIDIGTTLVIKIQDDGPGIAESALPHLFDSFYKGDNGNFGLGLAIAKTSAGLLGFKLKAENHSLGSIFTASKPLI